MLNFTECFEILIVEIRGFGDEDLILKTEVASGTVFKTLYCCFFYSADMNCI